MRRLIMVLAGLMAAGQLAHADEGPALAAVSIEPGDGGVTIVGRATALEGGRYEARMVIEKSGTSGRTSTRQGAHLDLAAGESADVARVGLSLQAGDSLAVTVEVMEDGAVVSRATTQTTY
ncbi:curli-like amyloid fiber formation chaperone CsgH [Pararhizobium haloflavum]|uniref:curli-like amyloid fiber formation chaperone CsgH n=1 Tax=Pararhizobium haloflavum TaxID=2037914 RepID=UPI000C1877B6|nr:curli-like amyloid fiber formation chaperone CsgH [Pararhizobium haloflavum]